MSEPRDNLWSPPEAPRIPMAAWKALGNTGIAVDVVVTLDPYDAVKLGVMLSAGRACAEVAGDGQSRR